MKQSVSQLLSKAKKLQKSGAPADAAKLFQAVLAQYPNNTRARDGLASLSVAPKTKGQTQPTQNQINTLITLLNNNQFPEILRLTTPLIRQFPQSVLLYNLQGAALSALGKTKTAIQSYKQALRLNPNHADTHTNLGNALQQTGDFTGAIASYKHAISLKPGSAEAHSNLGNALEKTDAFADAVKAYNQALTIRPDYAEAYYNLGIVQNKLSDLTGAINSYQEALNIQPDNARTLFSLGVVQKQNDELAAAILSYQRAIEISPNYAEVLNNLGRAYIEQGEFTEATDCFIRALKNDPNLAECYLNYSNITSFQPDDPILDMMRQRITKTDRSGENLMYISFALGKAEDDLGHHQAAFEHLKTANMLRKNQLNYDISNERRTFAQIKNYFEQPLQPISSPASTTQTPVFILGMPRSGSTLVEQILTSHSKVYGAGERGFLNLAVENSNWQTSDDAKQVFSDVRTSYLKSMSNLTNASNITDKTLHNIKLVGFLLNALPEAKVIHINRDPAAICWSNFKTFFPSSGMGFTFDQEDIAHYYNLCENLITFWREKFPTRIYDLNYEELTENQEPETRKLLEYVGLEWEDAVLSFHNNKRSVRTASNIQVRRGMYQGSSDEWQKYEQWLQPMLSLLNS